MASPTTIAQSKRADQKIAWLVSAGLGAIYTIGLAYIFFFARRRWQPLPKRSLHLLPFKEKILFWQSAGAHTRIEIVEFYKDLLGNLFLFIPFPFLLLFVFKIKKTPRLLLFSIAVSLCVEAIQYAFNIGIADIDDLILNTIGAAIGLALIRMLFAKAGSQRFSPEKWHGV